MNLADLYRRLSYGELSNLSMSSDTPGTIRDDAKPQIIVQANDALQALYRRFLLKEGMLILQMVEGQTKYRLEPQFSVQNAKSCKTHCAYIIDDECTPFNDTVLKVLQVFNHLGTELPINDQDNFYSVFTPKNDVLQVPHPTPGLPLSVSYQTFGRPLIGDDLEEEIDIPVVLEKALLVFIAGGIFGNMNTQESNAKSQEHLLNFETLCAEAEDKDLLSISNTSTNTKFHKRGWA